MRLSPNFYDELEGTPAMRARFQFAAVGTLGAGVYYVNKDMKPSHHLAAATAAAKIVAKRAGCPLEEVTLLRILPPTR